MKRKGLLPVAIVIGALIACGVLNKLDDKISVDAKAADSFYGGY